MRSLLLALGLMFGVGCSQVADAIDEVILTPNEAEELVDNFEAAVDAQQKMSEFVFAATRGDLDLTGVDYVPPSAANGFTGVLTFTGATLPFGTGDLTIVFMATELGVPVDPYVTDLTNAVDLVIDTDVTFDGISTIGSSLSAVGDLTITGVQNTVDSATALIQGTFDVDHGGYEVDLDMDDLQLTFDMLLDRITNVGGGISGEVDIPNFAFDADFDVDGLGDRLRVTIDAAATEISYTLALVDLF